jgi:TM2 domain-containing membrane protein YozV
MQGVAVLINFFLPGVGSFFVGQIGQGIAQMLIWWVGLIICFSVVGIIIGLPMMGAAWLWAIIGAATSNPKPLQVNVVRQDVGRLR